ncbi:MAG: hypothetical protein Q8T09_11420 [Candidatus Melainabacteria bacterium]|nr:hypothetical protein [Candidatus Melainabacteria bacterium]
MSTQQSQTTFVMDCTGMEGADLLACQSLNKMIAEQNLDMNTPSGQQTALEFHRRVYEVHQRQINASKEQLSESGESS